jgi:hypothetical protein
MADLTGLDWLFECPEEITDPDLRAGWETLRLKLQMELENMPVTTTALVRAERLLHWFLRCKQCETVGYGEQGGYSSPGQEKDVNAFVAQLLKDWDDVIIRSKPTGHEAVLTVERKFKQIFVEVVSAVEMPGDVRNELAERFSRTVVSAGLDHG